MAVKNKFYYLFGEVVKGGIFEPMKESFKIDSKIKERLSKQAKLTGRTITGLAELILDKKLSAMENGESLFDKEVYAHVMAPVLGRAIKSGNKKKK
jgi:hypothetical protein